MYLFKNWDPDIFVFVFARKCQPEYIHNCICQEMSTRTNLYLYLGLKIVHIPLETVQTHLDNLLKRVNLLLSSSDII